MKEYNIRDSLIFFDELTHTYFFNGKQLHGITSTLIPRCYPSTYDGIDEAILQHAAERGTACHKAVEDMINDGLIAEGKDAIVMRAKELLEGEGLHPIKTEYIVTDYENYASPIDILCINKDDELCVVDMKFTHDLHEKNVALQTSIYDKFFSIVNPGLDVKHNYVLWIRTNDYFEVKDSKILELRRVRNEIIDGLIEADKADMAFDISQYYGDLPAKVQSVEVEVKRIVESMERNKEVLDDLRDGLLKLMEGYGIKKYEGNVISLTRVAATKSTSFDSTRFKAEHPDLYEQYTKTTTKKSSLKITIKKGE